MKVQGIRTGGRSARVQKAVHDAVRDLLQSHDRDAITVPLIAQTAGVTPSTIYRRWGDLQMLLGDVALNYMHPDEGPEDTGSLIGDLKTFAEAYIDETTSTLGRSVLRDIVASRDDGATMRCCDIGRWRIGIILDRALARGEAVPAVETLIDAIIAPVAYRALFDHNPPDYDSIYERIDFCLARCTARDEDAQENVRAG